MSPENIKSCTMHMVTLEGNLQYNGYSVSRQPENGKKNNDKKYPSPLPPPPPSPLTQLHDEDGMRLRLVVPRPELRRQGRGFHLSRHLRCQPQELLPFVPRQCQSQRDQFARQE